MILQSVLDLDIPSVSTTQKRDFHGFAQFRDHPSSSWRFYVCGFDSSSEGEDGLCSVLRSDGTEKDVSIDAQNGILIHGRRYDSRFWDH